MLTKIIRNSNVFEGVRQISQRGLSLILIVTLITLFIFTELAQTGQSIAYLLLIGFLIHALVYSTVSLPILYAVWGLITTLPIFYINELAGMVAFFILLLITLNNKLKTKEWFHPVPPMVYVGGVVANVLILSPFNNPDSYRYFAQLEEYGTVLEYMQMLIGQLLSNPLWLTDFTDKFPFIYLPFYFSLNISNPKLFAVINAVLWLLTALMLVDLGEVYIKPRIDYFSSRLFFTLLLLSPFLIYYSSQIMKEITVVFLITLSTYLFLRNRYILFMPVVASAFYLRAYSIVVVGIYILYFRKHVYLILFGLASSFFSIVLYSGTLLIAINSIVIFVFTFFTPLPVEFQNWMAPTAAFRTLESAIYGTIFVMSLGLGLVYRRVRTEYVLLASGICIYATVMALLGFHRINTGILAISYEFLTIGSHVARKKSLVQPLIIIWGTITIQIIRHRLPNIKINY